MKTKDATILSMKKLLALPLALLIMLSGFMGVTAQGAEADSDNTKPFVLMEKGVQVTMSSAAMPAASSALATGATGTMRGPGWLTDDKEYVEYRNTRMDGVDLTRRAGGDATIVIDENTTYQAFTGIGTSLEHTTVWNLMQLSENQRRETIRYIIDPVDGLGMSMFRVPIGTSDFFPAAVTGLYSLYDIPGNEAPEEPDWYNETGEGFSLEKDRNFGVVTVLQTFMEEADALGIKDEIHFYGTPWSPPGWMKSNGKGDSGMAGGQLKDVHIADAAMYYVRWMEEYAKEGVPIFGMTLQNQAPYNFSIGTSFPTCHVTAAQAAKLAAKIKEYATASEIISDDIQLFALDMSWGEANSDTYTYNVLAADEGINSVDGVAMHDYRSNPIFTGLSKISSEYGKSVMVSERYLCGTYGAERMVNYYRNNAISYTSWVSMLSTAGGDLAATFADEVMFMRNPDRDNEVRYLPEAHLIGQFGKIRTGYVRVASTLGKDASANFGLTNVTFKDPATGDLVMVVVNNQNNDDTFTVSDGSTYQFEAEIPATTVATYVWNPTKMQANGIINEATALNRNDYTAGSWSGLEEAIASARQILSDDNASLDAIEAVARALQDAIDALVDLSELRDLVANVSAEVAKLFENNYTPDSWAILQGALADAQAVLADENASIAALQSNVSLLNSAWSALEQKSSNAVNIKLSGEDNVTVGNEAVYKLSVANTERLSTVTVWLEVDGDFFAGKEAVGLNNFETVGGVDWQQLGGSLWSGRITLAHMDGGVSDTNSLDIMDFVMSTKDKLGDTSVRITRVELSGYDENGTAVFCEAIVTGSVVDTTIEQVFSIYDVNRDGNVDQLDITTAQKFYGAREGDSDWENAVICDVNSDGRVDIEDLILILNHIVW